MRRTLSAVAALAIASLAAAQLAKYKDWARSPEAYFLTSEERAEWSKTASDTDAEKFIALYWAKRGGDRFREEIQRRIAAADEQFKMRRQRGAESARGRLLIILGGPSRVSQSRAPGEAGPDSGPSTGGPPGSNPFAPGPGEQAIIQTWIYEKGKFDPSWGIGEIRARITVDPQRGADELQKDSAVDRAIAKVAEKSIVSPSAAAAAAPGSTAGAPAVAAPNAPPAAAPAPAGAAASAPVPPAAAALPAATRTSLEALAKSKKEESGFWGGPFRSATGDPFYVVEFYFEGEKAPAGPAKFGGVVSGESGAEVAAFWEDATLSDMKTGSRADKVYERAIVLPPGSYHAAFGIFSADGANAIESTSVSFKLEPRPSEIEVSPLILTNELKPLTKRPGPTDPFVFGSEKPIKVEAKGNHLFSKQDSLWYFYAIQNPKLPEGTAPAAQTPPTPSSADASKAGAAPAEAPKPRIMQRIGVLRDGKPAFAPLTGPAEMQMLAPGYYASGSEIPLATFEPGYYTFTLDVRDLNAPRDSTGFKGIDRQADFIVLKPDGSLPEKAASKPPPPPTPKPRPKKS